MWKFSFSIHFYEEGKRKVDDFDLYKKEFKKKILLERRMSFILYLLQFNNLVIC